MKKIILSIFIAILFLQTNAQDTNLLILKFEPYDFPYQNIAAQTVSGTNTPAFGDYMISLRNPSMHQSLALSTSYYNSLFYGLSKMKIKIFKKDFYNYLAESIIFTGALAISEYMPLGDSWLHEEFHRAVLTKNFVDSYDQVYDFPIFSNVIMVYDVTDEDLIKFKGSNASDFVRLHEAGIEGEYSMVKNLQKLNFFENQPFAYNSLELLWTVNSIYYVWMCHTDAAEEETIKANIEDGTDISKRDFTGLDFTAWVYDLYRPTERYQTRGIHPSGVGIDRYRKPSDLLPDELAYLKKQGYLQLINLASPMLLGIKQIHFKKQDFYMNFAFRHILTSFGNDIVLNLFFKKNKLNIGCDLHLYNSAYLHLPGIDLTLYNQKFKFGNYQIINNFRVGAWLQPDGGLFYDVNTIKGGMIETETRLQNRNFYLFFDLSAKSRGWVMGNVFQNKNFSVRTGFGWVISPKK